VLLGRNQRLRFSPPRPWSRGSPAREGLAPLYPRSSDLLHL